MIEKERGSYYLQHEHERENGYTGEGEHVIKPGGSHPRDLEDAVEDHADDVVPDIQPASNNSLKRILYNFRLGFIHKSESRTLMA